MLSAAEMFWEDAGTRTRGEKGLKLMDGTSDHIVVIAKRIGVWGIFMNGIVRKTL